MSDKTPAISLRHADFTDLDFAYQVKKTAFADYIERTYGAWDEALQRSLHEGQWRATEAQIVVSDGCDVGWIWVIRNPDHWHLKAIYILPEYQGRGIGSTLVNRLQDEARKAGLAVRLWVMKINPAITFYKNAGFTVIGEKETHWHMEAGCDRSSD